MSPRRPRRRARRRSPARPVILLVAVVILLALLVGGLTQVSRQSQGYDAASARALAAQDTLVAQQSNATSAQVRSLMNGLPGETRQGLQVALDSAVQQTADQSARASLASGAVPSGAVATQLADVFAERAQSMADLRAAVDGFLGMQPIPSTATVDDGPVSAAPTPSLSATQATNRIAAAGALLEGSDALYRSARRSLANGAGRGRLPASVWVTRPQLWRLGTLAAQVDLIATSPTLAATHDVVLRTVRLDPPALPTPQGTSAGVSVLSPSQQVSVNVVVANQGSVEEPHVVVRDTLADQTTGASVTQSQQTALALDASVAMPSATFSVKPGTAYVLTVQVIPPAGQTQTVGTALQQALQIAPGT
jgi:hypothetical protein